ncbi:MAG: phosphodiester glycosidase family protein [Bacteroidia bacterium]|nr:phosphodiester glycosidase family protein [Bacteroidia bacterium]
MRANLAIIALLIFWGGNYLPAQTQKEGKKVAWKDYQAVIKENKRLKDSLRVSKRDWERKFDDQEEEIKSLSQELGTLKINQKEESSRRTIILNILADSLYSLAAHQKDTALAGRLVKMLNRDLGPLTGRSFDLKRNLRPGSQTLDFLNQEFDIFILDLARDTLQLFWQDGKGENYSSIGNLKTSLESQGKSPLMITNAGMYTPAHAPQGLYVENGEEKIPLDKTDGGEQKGMNFFMLPNGVFGLDQGKFFVDDTREYDHKNPTFATQSGPMLLKDWSIHPKFNQGSTNKYVRSGVGVINSHKVVFAISRRQVNFYDFASLFLNYFGCRDALYLDGAISKMWIQGLNEEQGGNFGPIISVIKK